MYLQPHAQDLFRTFATMADEWLQYWQHAEVVGSGRYPSQCVEAPLESKGIPQLMVNRWGHDKYLPQPNPSQDQWIGTEHTRMRERMNTEIMSNAYDLLAAEEPAQDQVILHDPPVLGAWSCPCGEINEERLKTCNRCHLDIGADMRVDIVCTLG